MLETLESPKEAVAEAGHKSVEAQESPRVVAEKVADVAAEVLNVPHGEMAEYVEASLADHPELVPSLSASVAGLEERVKKSDDLSGQLDAAIASAPSVERKAEKKGRGGVVGRFLNSLRRRFSKEKPQKNSEVPVVASVRAEVSAISDSALEAAGNVTGADQAEALKTPVNGALDAKRAEVLESGREVKRTGEELIRAAQEKLAGLMKGESLDELQRAQAYFEKLDEKGALDGFVLDGKAMTPEDIKLHINYLAAATVNTAMDAEIDKVFSSDESHLRGKGYRELSAILKPYVNMERLGSKKGLEVKMFFSKLLKSKLNSLDSTKEATKVALLGHFIRANGLN